MIMGTPIATIVLLLLCFLSATTFNFSLCIGDRGVLCNEKEKQALLDFKQGLTDPSDRLSSWSVHKDCCQWTGVHCDNLTSRVIELHLSESSLGGKITPSLLKLEFLCYLDLTGNDFRGTPIPSFLGSMRSLRHLNLKGAEFGGLIPYQLQNLSRLHYLNIGANYGLYVDDLGWIAHLHALEYLDMYGVKVHREVDWLQVVSILPSLSELYLSGCQLHTMIPSLGPANFTSLKALFLSENNFNCRIPNWLFNLSSSLLQLELSENSFYGPIPDWIGQLKHLEYLDLSINKLNGPIPESLGNLSSLSALLLSMNQLTGALPKTIGHLSNLFALSISYINSMAGTVSEVNFATLSKLKQLDMSLTPLIFNFNPNWVPPFQLEYLEMSNCKMGPNFPAWLRTQTSLRGLLDISHTGISDTAPDWFWDLASRIEFINLSDNQIDGNLSHVLLNSSRIDISSNRFKGQLPRLSSYVQVLNIANNSLSGHFSSFLCRKANRKSKLAVLDVSNNLLSGGLYVSNNLLSGGLSHCWMYWQSLTHVNLGSNNLSGKIPNSIGSLFELRSLQLHDNKLLGDIPLSLKNCLSLGLINLGENEFTGLIPSWIGERNTLLALRLRSNKFSGNIPPNVCQLSSIFVLDLANNSLSGAIPQCLNNFSEMASTDTSDLDPYYVYFEPFEYDYDSGSYMEALQLVIKGSKSEYRSILGLVRTIDLSSNNLSGSIPTEISRLAGLHFLNLSHNHLVGEIPEKLGSMTMLESLDLSRNHLSGEIPQSMSNLTFLDYLDLSYNFLSGKIPSSTQLQSFSETSFMGNAGLCGVPLMEICREESQGATTPVCHEDVEESEMFWFYIGIGPGFATGFWGVCGALFFKKTWRHAYFQFLYDMKNRVYISAMLMVNWVRRKFSWY